MLLSHTKRFIFIHVYKVAGTSVREALRREDCLGHSILWRFAQRLTGLSWYRDGYLGNLRKLNDLKKGHLTLAEAQAFLPEDVYIPYFKFAFVRNPWSWQVSLYEYARKTSRHFQNALMSRFSSFDEYIRWRVDNEVRLQTTFVVDRSDQCGLNYLGRLETIGEDWERICDRLGISAELPRINVSVKRDYRTYYSEETAELVKDAFSTDVGNFGYDFDGISPIALPALPIATFVGGRHRIAQGRTQ